MEERKDHFTPGPWMACEDGLIDKMVVGGNYELIIDITHHDGKRNDADAFLIAAAPELLESLDEALELIQDLCFGGCATVSDEECEKASAMLKKGYAALDKARGEE